MPDLFQAVVAGGSDNLSKKVNEYLDKGYELSGSLSISQCYAGLDDAGKPVVKVLLSQGVVLYGE